jgi:DNA polymerase (family 10)
MAGLSNKEIAAVFKEIEILMRVLGEDAGRAVGYGRVSLTLKNLPESAADLAAAGQLTKVKGIGPKVQAAVAEIVDTGTCRLRDDLHARLPAGVPEILRVPGLGPKRVHTVLTELGVESIEELQAAATDGRVAALPGFGAKSAQKIVEGIDFLNRTRGRMRVAAAWSVASAWIERLGLAGATVAGPLRRGTTTVDRIALVAAGDPASIEPPGGALADGVWTVPRGREPEIRIRLVPETELARALFEETGPADHVEAVLARPGTDATEEELYTSRDLHFVPPERRHACDGTAPVPRLVERGDLQGLVHAHTDWSDGTQSLAEMAAAAAERGYTYFALTDHSQIAVYANGLTVERLREQAEAVRAFNAQGGPVRVLHGTEVDILPDGSLDFPDEALADLDFVIASIHSTFTQDEEKMTARIVKAVRHPHVDILGHPTGRLLLRRGPYAVDMERVMQAAAECGTCIELNASPWRLDLDPDLHGRAVELGIGVPICPDAHAAAGMDDVDWGVRAARHGGLRAEDVPNTRDADGFLEAIGR